MRKHLRKSQKGFTLIELMIVVAIIGILAAIAIPNFLRFQLRARSAEGKTNIAAIRTAQEGYQAEFGQYLLGAMTPLVPGVAVKSPFVAVLGGGFDLTGFAPEGQVYFSYAVNVIAGNNYTIDAIADIDGDGATQMWGYLKPDPLGAFIAGLHGCVIPGPLLPTTVGPCTAGSGASLF